VTIEIRDIVALIPLQQLVAEGIDVEEDWCVGEVRINTPNGVLCITVTYDGELVLSGEEGFKVVQDSVNTATVQMAVEPDLDDGGFECKCSECDWTGMDNEVVTEDGGFLCPRPNCCGAVYAA
jgi:hypothetical protein